LIDEGIENYETSEKFTDAQKAALRFSDWMANRRGEIDEAFYGELKKHYSTGEIVEFGAFIAFNIGYHTFFGSLDFYPMFTPDGRLVSQDESRSIYGDRPVSLTKGAMERATAAAAKDAG
jgi:hypothetical protein